MDDRKPLAMVTKTNTYKLVIYEMTSDDVLIGFNNEEPSWVDIEYDYEGEPYVNYFGMAYLSEFVKQQ